MKKINVFCVRRHIVDVRIFQRLSVLMLVGLLSVMASCVHTGKQTSLDYCGDKYRFVRELDEFGNHIQNNWLASSDESINSECSFRVDIDDDGNLTLRKAYRCQDEKLLEGILEKSSPAPLSGNECILKKISETELRLFAPEAPFSAYRLITGEYEIENWYAKDIVDRYEKETRSLSALEKQLIAGALLKYSEIYVQMSRMKNHFVEEI